MSIRPLGARLSMKTHKGFTLIELMTVVAIVGLLSSMMFAGFSEARERARDGQRLSQMKEVITAIELYKDRNGGAAPNHGGSGATLYGCDSGNCLAVLTDELVPSYLPAIPVDPFYGNVSLNGYRYCRGATTSQFSLVIWGEKQGGWCTIQHSANVTGTGCWMTSSAPDFGWCKDEM